MRASRNDPPFFFKLKSSLKDPFFFIVLTKWPPIFLLSSLKDPLFSLVCHRKTPTLGVVSAHPRHDMRPPSPYSSANEQMRKDPLLTSLHFERRWRAFLKYILKGKTKPLGKLNDYFARIEHRNGGSSHLHIFLWIEDAPAVHQSSIRNLITYDSVEDLTYVWRTRAWKIY